MSKYDLISKLLSKKDVNILGDLYDEKEFNVLSEWSLFNAKWVIFQLYHGETKLHSGQVNYCHHLASDIVFRSLRWWVITYKKNTDIGHKYSYAWLLFSPYTSYKTNIYIYILKGFGDIFPRYILQGVH